jgi:type IV pilus assembly protein PilX
MILLHSNNLVISRRQHGVALVVVLVLIMLAMLMALWATRSAWFNQMIVGNDADYQRAFAAAQAMLQDAELDITRRQPDGKSCAPNTAAPMVCRSPSAVNNIVPPVGSEDTGPLIASLSEIATTNCSYGFCSKRLDPQDFWNNSTLLSALQVSNVGSRYGQFTGATTATNTDEIGATGNAILNQTGNGNVGAWYWIEVLNYPNSEYSSLIAGNTNNILPLKVNPKVIYRITAIAYGQKKGTRVVLQQVLAPQKADI